MYKVLICDDDGAALDLLVKNVHWERFNMQVAATASNGMLGLEAYGKQKIDLVILDINLPDGNGFDYLKQVRKISNVPVLILTANDTELDEVMVLTLGADDYVTKPFSLMTLRLRVNNLLARAGARQAEYANRYEKHGLVLDFSNLLFQKNGVEIELSKTEIRLLKYFTENEGITLPREKLIDHVWQNQQYVDENALSVTVKRLRDKIESSGERLIHTIYGIGYVFRQ